MNEEYREQYLMHYGVKGMRWGIRRNRKSSSSEVRKKSSDDNEVKKKASKSKSRKKVKVTKMTDSEIEQRISRLRLENELDRLTKTGTREQIEYVVRNLGSIATATSTAITIYNNIDKIMDIAKKVSKRG